MKKIVCLLVVLLICMSPGCAGRKQVESNTQWAVSPMLILNDYDYVAPYMPVSELPDGYAYAGTLSNEEANNTGLSGCSYYLPENAGVAKDFYVYQECGTPIGENIVDSTKLQWAYVQWILVNGAEESASLDEEEESVGPDGEREMFVVDEEQSFSFDLQPLGTVRFLSHIPQEPTACGRDAFFEIVKDDAVVQTLDDPDTAAVKFFEKIEAVAFADYNRDGLTDIIVITRYDILGGPDTGTAEYGVKYYAVDKAGMFTFDRALSADATAGLPEFTIAAAREYAAANRSADASGQEIYREKYRESLRKLIQEHIFPNGNPADDSFISQDDFSGNQFAVCDVDADGIEELLISYCDSTTAGMVFYIFQYDIATDTFVEELSEFPSVMLFEGGYLTVGISHNQGMAGGFWPYSIYRYDGTTDSYRQIAFIDAWDEEMFPADYEGNPFPADIDTSDSGFVYYIYRDGNYDEDTAPVDETEHQKLVDETYGGREEMEIEYLDLTIENVEKI